MLLLSASTSTLVREGPVRVAAAAVVVVVTLFLDCSLAVRSLLSIPSLHMKI